MADELGNSKSFTQSEYLENIVAVAKWLMAKTFTFPDIAIEIAQDSYNPDDECYIVGTIRISDPLNRIAPCHFAVIDDDDRLPESRIDDHARNVAFETFSRFAQVYGIHGYSS